MDAIRLPLPPGAAPSNGGQFVGRKHELLLLGEIWDSVAAGRRHVVFVGGEPGAGKTRFTAEVAKACHDDGAVVLLGSNTRDLGLALEPFIEIAEQLVAQPSIRESLPLATAQTLARLSPLVAESVGVDPPDVTSDARGEFFEAIADLVRMAGAHGAVVVIIESLHWAGSQTLQMLSHLVNKTTDLRLLVIATHRTTAPDRTDELTISIAELYGLPGVTRIDLPGLNADDIARYVAAASGISADEARRPAAVLRDQTGGNAFFLEEVWRDLDTQGGLRRFTERALEAPRSVRDMLELRIRGLPQSALDVLERAAVAGDSTDMDLLTSDHGDIENVLDALDSGVAFGLLSDTDSQRFVFRHSLTRQAVVARMPRHRRLQLHARAAVALERQRRHSPEVVAALAHHFSEASSLGYSQQATRYLAESAEAARASLAHDEAARAFQRASEMAGGSVELLFESAESLRDAGRLVEARLLYRDLCETSDPVRYARAAVGFEMSAWEQNAQPDLAVTLLTTALDRLDPGSPWHIRTMASLGRALQAVGATSPARDLGVKALQRARETRDQDLIAHSLMCLIHHMWEPHELQTLVEMGDELSTLAYKSGKMMQLAVGHGASLNARYRLGHADAYEADLPRAHWAVEASGQPFVALSGACMMISDAYKSGRFVEAQDLAEKLHSEGQVFGESAARGVYGMQMFAIKRATGELGRLPRPLVTAAAEQGAWKPGRLALYVEHRMTDEVRDVLPSVLRQCDDTPRVSAQWAALAVFAVEAIALVRDVEAAERIRAMLEPFSGTNLMAGHLLLTFGSANRYLAILDHVLDRDSAGDQFRTALEMDRSMRSPVHEAETLLSFAAHLESKEEVGEAASVRKKGTAIAKRIGLKRRIPLADRSVTTGDLGWIDLSPRETDVLRLLALGMSNREIGVELMISANTAANHVRSILMKTGSSNRTQAAVYAANRDLA